ncbi:MAG: hypothetical protein D6695_11450 [Planctomycetota bacterium]|nr:MAG: hypothetical protein D6695_11450 [Planctomycetota bacterium]
MNPIAQPTTPPARAPHAGDQLASLVVRWSLAAGEGPEPDLLVLEVRAGRAVLMRQSQRTGQRTLREQTIDLPIERASSACGRFTGISLPGVIDAVFASDGRCAYARSRWIADLAPLGGQCQLIDAEIEWAAGG